MKRVENREYELEALKQELELETVPAAVEQKLRQVYAELPDQLPGKRNSSVKTFWKTASGVAGGLAAAFLLLLGLNGVNPALAESIPGIGGLFSALNNGMHPMGSNVGTFGDGVQKLGLRASAAVDSGYSLLIDDSFCDGKFLYLTLRLSCPEEAEKYESVGFRCEGESDWELRVNGTPVELISSGGEELEKDQAMAYVARLPEEMENGERMDVSLRVGTLYGIYPDYKTRRKADAIETGFTASFFAVTDTTQNSKQEISAEDNGVKLYGIERTPGYFLVDMEIPFWGRTGDELLSGGPIKGYAMLFTEDGRELRHNSALDDYDFANEEEAESIWGTWAFDGPPEDSGKVILRVLEHAPDSRLIAGEEEKPAVFAEFTIDWKNGGAAPSDTYGKEGYEKADTREYLDASHHADFTGGYLVQDISHTHDMWHDSDRWLTAVQLLSDVEYQPLEMRFYRGDERIGAVKSHPESEYNDEEFGGGSWPAYRDETGFYTAMSAEESTDGEAKYMLLFACYYPEDAERDEHGILVEEERIDRIELVNSETGEVLFQDGQIGETRTGE